MPHGGRKKKWEKRVVIPARIKRESRDVAHFWIPDKRISGMTSLNYFFGILRCSMLNIGINLSVPLGKGYFSTSFNLIQR